MPQDQGDPAGAPARPFRSPIENNSTAGTIYRAGPQPDTAPAAPAREQAASAQDYAAPAPDYPAPARDYSTPARDYSTPARDYAVNFDDMAGAYRSSSATTYSPGRADPADYAVRELDDTVLGLTYRTVAPRRTVGDPRWEGALRSFARAMVWCMPAGVLAFALASVWGAPTATQEPSLVSPGTWLLFALLGLALWLIGVVGVSALVAATPMRIWGLVAVLTTIVGVVLIAPVAGIAGLARPAIHRTAAGIEGDATIAGAADNMQAQLLGNSVGRLLTIGGAVLLAIGAFAVAGAVLGSRGLSRVDGWLVVLAAFMAIAAVYLGWGFVLILAAMVALAGTLGLAFTVSRTAPDGTAPSMT